MKLVSATVLLAICALGHAPTLRASVDDVKGFRQFEFGSTIDSLDKLAPGTKYSRELKEDETVVAIAGPALKQPTLYSAPIEKLLLHYWKNELFEVDVELTKTDPERPQIPDTELAADRFYALERIFRKMLGNPSPGEQNDSIGGLFRCEWMGAKTCIRVDVYCQGVNLVQGVPRVPMSNSVSFYSVPRVNARKSAIQARMVSKDSGIKDGIN